MDVDPSSVNGETELNAYMRVQQVANDTDPLMWWKQDQQEFPCLTRTTRQYLVVPVSSSSPERLFSSVGLVKSDLRCSLLETTLIDVMWAKQAPYNQLERELEEVFNHQDIHTIYWHTAIYVTDTHQYLSLEHTNIYSASCRLTVPHTWQSLPTINQLLISTSIDKPHIDKPSILITSY